MGQELCTGPAGLITAESGIHQEAAVYVLAALACRDARSEGDALDVVGAFNAFPADSFPVQLSPFKLVVRLVWDRGEYGRFVVGLRLVNAAAVDLIHPTSAAFSFEPPDTWRTWRAGRSS